MTIQEIREEKYKDFPVQYGYVVGVGTLLFKEIRRDNKGKRYPVFADSPYDARVYLNKDNADRVQDWLQHYLVENKPKYEFAGIAFCKEIRICKYHKNIKGDD